MSILKLTLTLPLPPSVNAMYRYGNGRAYKTDAAKAWAQEVGYVARSACKRQNWKCAKGRKVRLTLKAFWPDARRRDMNNLHKALCDALEHIVYDNDRYVLITDEDYRVDRQRPRIEVVVEMEDGSYDQRY